MLSTAAENSAAERSGRIIRAGFIAVMVLMAGIALFAAIAQYQAGRALDDIVYLQQQATELQLRMLRIARERAVELYHIASAADPAEREAHMRRFGELGGRLGEVRNELLDMGQDARARELLEKQWRQAETGAGWKDEVVALAAAGRREDAMRVLVEKAIPAQDAMMATLNELMEYRAAATREKAGRLQRLQLVSIWLLAVAGVLAVLLAGVTARFVRRGMDGLVGEISATARQLQDLKLAMDRHDKIAQQVLLQGHEDMERQVRERTAELEERENLLRSITDVAHDAVIMLDRDGKVIFWNPAAEKIFGYGEAEILGRSLHGLLVADPQLEDFRAGLAELQQSGGGALTGKTVELAALRKDGAEVFIEIALSAVRIKGAWHVVGIARDITTRKQAEQQLEFLATTDPLTGIANRRRFDGVLHVEVARSSRYGVPLSLVMFDIDHFKRINDSFGHPVGDRVLVRLAELVAANIRETDLFARLGGEEFAVLLPNCDAECARQLAEKLRRLVQAQVFDGIGRITCSFGVAEHRRDEDENQLIKRADEALYQAKGGGRNRVSVAPRSDGISG